MNPGSPVKSRVKAIDAIRGLALLGILLVNLLSFHSPHFMYGGMEGFYSGSIEHVLLASIDMFVQASFYPLFSLLFGLGIYMMFERLQQKRLNPKPILLRRMFVLMGFGLLHGIFIWYGDILLTYSVIGLISLLFISKSAMSLMKWAFNLLLIPAVLMTLLMFLVREYSVSMNSQLIQQAMLGYSGNLESVMSQNFFDWLNMNHPLQWLFMILSILPMFLLGIMIKKRGWIDETQKNNSEIKKWLLGSFVVFILFKIAPYLFGMPTWFDYAQDAIGGSFSSIFYFLVLLVIFKSRNFSAVERILSNVGKLSLTNYVMQSLIGTTLFYGIGFNLYGELNLVTLMVIGMAIFGLQIIFSQWYVKRFYFGPLEWVYRTLTYNRVQPMVKKDD
ncbi:DUF418 domain-containing protein [Tenuibacillus multivorans]|uniref:DUF418 domain-containing protein n=1 Tax=Tenuibacillus multivorans TaxID=237069 RepID=A0A1H0A019_9BACI|nr:DUF418 domain-containing protein [Tenuibacillus multivorans]GEL78346.1 hypothetical protein TMU01_25810 [Tenuibacillus multivorans]SDN26930.1 uncharacterized protein SAMN05216498_1911 [Tenuibacillus multivorans]